MECEEYEELAKAGLSVGAVAEDCGWARRVPWLFY